MQDASGEEFDAEDPILKIGTRRSEELPFLVDMLKSAIATARIQHQTISCGLLEIVLARLHDYSNYHTERAVQIWENHLNTHLSMKERMDAAIITSVSLADYARHCLQRSVELGRDAAKTRDYGALIERLLEVDTCLEFPDPFAPPRILGAWHKFMEQDEEAQVFFRQPLKQCLQMLSDDDPLNDVDAFVELSRTLIMAEDEENLMAVYVKSTELEYQNNVLEHAEQGGEGNQGREGLKGSEENANALPITGNCDRCERDIPFDGVTSICKYCRGGAFCQDCVPFVATGETICDPRHSFLVLKPIPKEAFQPASLDTIWFNNQRISMDEWKTRLAEKYSIKM